MSLLNNQVYIKVFEDILQAKAHKKLFKSQLFQLIFYLNKPMRKTSDINAVKKYFFQRYLFGYSAKTQQFLCIDTILPLTAFSHSLYRMTSTKPETGRNKTSLFSSFLQICEGQLWLRQFFANSRKAQLNQLLKAEDTLSLKKTIFTSGFALFNLGLLTLFAARRFSYNKIILPALLLGFTGGVHQIGVVWLNRQFLRAIEITDSEQAYFLRRKLLREVRQNEQAVFVKGIVGHRLGLMERMNHEYQKIYGMEDRI